jgi:hypothetical protein
MRSETWINISRKCRKESTKNADHGRPIYLSGIQPKRAADPDQLAYEPDQFAQLGVEDYSFRHGDNLWAELGFRLIIERM